MNISKKVKKTIIYAMIFLIILIIATCLIHNYRSSASDRESTNDNKLRSFVELQKQRIEMKEKLNKNTPLLDLYMSVNVLNLNGATKTEAVNKATDRYIENQAILWYANKEGIVASDVDINSYIEKCINDAKSANNYEEINAICKDLGITFEETFWGNRDLYEFDYISGKVYDAEIKKYELIDNQNQQTWNEYWGNFTREKIESYKETQAFKKMNKALNASKKLVINTEHINVQIAKNKDIYIE